MDRYDKQVKFLEKNPGLIFRDWAAAKGLFKFVPHEIGCLTMIRSRKDATTVIGQKIQKDVRLPMVACKIEAKHLPVFAEWQRKLDKKFAV